MNVILLNQEYNKTVINKDLLNVAIQLLGDTQYTKEMAVEEIMELIKKVENIR